MKDKGYINIQGWMISKLKLQGNELVLYALIFGFSQDGVSQFRGSLTYIEKALGITRKSVSLNLKKLLDKKLIKKEDHNTGNLYSVESILPKNEVGEKVPTTRGESIPVSRGESIPNIYNTNNKDNNNIYAHSFEEIWELYKFKKGKKNAILKFKTIYDKQTKPLQLVEKIKKAIPKYLEHLKIETWRQQKQLEFWLNGECWNDEYEVKKSGKQTNIIHTQSDKYNNLKITKAKA